MPELPKKEGSKSRPQVKSRALTSLVTRILVTTALLVTFYLHVHGTKMDEVGVAILVLAMVPWVGVFLETAEVFGMKFQFRRMEQKQREISESFRWLNELTGLMIGEPQQAHLKNIVDGNFPATFYDDSPFEDELRHLIAISLIARRSGRGFRSISKEANSNDEHRVNIGNHLEITERGRRYLRLLDKNDL